MIIITNTEGITLFEVGANRFYRRTEHITADWRGMGKENTVCFFYMGNTTPFLKDKVGEIIMDETLVTVENVDILLRELMGSSGGSTGETPDPQVYNLAFAADQEQTIAVATASKEEDGVYFYAIPSGSRIAEVLDVSGFETLSADYSFTGIHLKKSGNVTLESVQAEEMSIDKSEADSETTMSLRSCVVNKFSYTGNRDQAVTHILESTVMTEASLTAMKIKSLQLTNMNFNMFRKVEFENCEFLENTLETFLNALTSFVGSMSLRYVDCIPELSEEQKQALPAGITLVEE